MPSVGASALDDERTPEGASFTQSFWDGAGLAAFLVVLTAVETYDAARRDIQALGHPNTPVARDLAELATPDSLWKVWTVTALIGAGLGARAVVRFIAIARELDRSRDRQFLARARAQLPVFAWGALGVWLLWQAIGIAVITGSYTTSKWLVLGAHILTIGLAVIALFLGGAAVGDATVAIERGSLVRVHLAFLLVLFIAVFHAGFVSDQLTDVLRGWGDASISRPLAGIAGALLLGAVLRASAARLLLPHPRDVPVRSHKLALSVAEQLRALRDRHASWLSGRRATLGVGVIFGAAVAATGFRTLGLVLLGVAGIIAATQSARSPPDLSEDAVRGVRRLIGTVGTVPLAILLVGLTGAATNSLLLPSDDTEHAPLLFWAAAVVVLFLALAAQMYIAAWTPDKLAERVRGESAGAVGALVAALSVISSTASAALLAVGGLLLAFRVFGERGAIELWAAWGIGLGLTVAVYAEPVEVPRGFGGFGVTLLGATAVFALLHVAASVGARRELRCKPHWRTPVLAMLIVWAAVAWAIAVFTHAERNQIREVNAVGEREELAVAVKAWLNRHDAPVGRDPRRSYIPVLLVAASGGGSKAAYWTDLVLDCVFGERVPGHDTDADECGPSERAADRYTRLLLTSSVSGGSVGVYHALRHYESGKPNATWVKDTAGVEVLSPLLAWGLFHDLPALMVGAPTNPTRCDYALSCPFDADRAAVQAAAIAGDEGREDSTASSGGLLARKEPITVFNTAQVHRADTNGVWPIRSWRRVVLSRLALAQDRSQAPACDEHPEPIRNAIDGHDLLPPDRDVTLLDAAILSARFPFLEPPGELGALSEAAAHPCATQPSERKAKIRDGGTYENSGLLTLFDLLAPIRQAAQDWQRSKKNPADVRLIVASIDDDVPGIPEDQEYDGDLLGSDKPKERTRAVRGKLRGCAVEGVTYLRISPEPHIGAQAATGWELSKTSRRDDLFESMERGKSAGNTVQRLRNMLDGSEYPKGCTRQRN